MNLFHTQISKYKILNNLGLRYSDYGWKKNYCVKSDNLMTKHLGNNNKRAYLWLLRKGLSFSIVLTTKCHPSFPDSLEVVRWLE